MRFSSSRQALQNSFPFDTTSDSSLNSETRCCGLIVTVAADDDDDELVLLHLRFPHGRGLVTVLRFLSNSDFCDALNLSSKDIALCLVSLEPECSVTNYKSIKKHTQKICKEAYEAYVDSIVATGPETFLVLY